MKLEIFLLQPFRTFAFHIKPRSPKEDVMKLILEDIEQSVLLFPEDGYINKNLASKPAAYALKADVLMWKAKVLNGGNTHYKKISICS